MIKKNSGLLLIIIYSVLIDSVRKNISLTTYFFLCKKIQKNKLSPTLI